VSPQSWDFSPRGQGRVILATILGTVGTLVVALMTVSFTTPFMSPFASGLTWTAAIGLPLVMTAPLCYAVMRKLRELAIAHHELALIAAQDSLTTCLNRGAFITLVDAYLTQVNAPPGGPTGGLLIIDVDHFKSVNDRFGHSAGDRALRLIVGGIQAVVRSTDLVGRVGGEEFAVFLPKADLSYAVTVAERIRLNVQATEFSPDGQAASLSVSIGGAVFTDSTTFEDLFNAADMRLYAAKAAGRNRAMFMSVA
jgi:diguanylate cyclase